MVMKKIVTRLGGLLVCTLVGCVLLFLLLPYIADHFIFPRVLQDLPFEKKRISLSRLSPWSVEVRVDLTDSAGDGLEISRILLVSSPGEFLRGKVAAMVIDAATIHVEREEGKIRLRGLKEAGGNKTGGKGVGIPAFPGIIERIRLKNCVLIFHEGDDQRNLFRFNGILRPVFQKDTRGGYYLETLKGKLATTGDVHSTVDIQGRGGKSGYDFLLTTSLPQLGQLAKLIPQFQGIHLEGEALTTTMLSFDHTGALVSYSQEVEIVPFLLQKGTLTLQDMGDGVHLRLYGTDQRITLQSEGTAKVSGQEVMLRLEAEYDTELKQITGTGTLDPGAAEMVVELSFTGSHEDTTADLQITVQGDGFRHGDSLVIGELRADIDAHINRERIEGSLVYQADEITDERMHVTLRKLSADFPFSYYFSDTLKYSSSGTLEIGEIEYKEVKSAVINGALKLTPDGLTVKTVATSPLLDDFRMTCNGTASNRLAGEMTCAVAATEVDQELLQVFTTLPDETTVSGKVTAEMHLSFEDGTMGGEARIDVSEGRWERGEHTLSGLDVQLHIPDLPTLRSAPGQIATISDIQLGTIRMADARIRFRVDDSTTLFIEGARLNWCGGRVETGGIRLSREMEEIETTLYCDRLGYTELLKQLGIGDAEGEGSLNGRLPLFLGRDGVRFDDGFLFSTPGNGGIVRFRNTEQLRQGMGGIDQTVYIDYSLQALENFYYNWTKLTFNSEKDQLLLTLQLDGKPAVPLPYGYKQGQMVRKQTGPGVQHPIRLDVNFRLPLDDLFTYGKNIQSLMENM